MRSLYLVLASEVITKQARKSLTNQLITDSPFFEVFWDLPFDGVNDCEYE